MKLTTPFDEIVAYTYQSDIYCPECVLEVMDHEPPNKNTNSVEDYLNEIASDPSYPINRNDEHSFDGDIFPKVVLACQLESIEDPENPSSFIEDRCGGCGDKI